MNGFIDVHTHILPGVDDGSKSVEVSRKMIQDAYEAGTRVIVLTPHYKRRYQCGDAGEMKRRFEEFKNYMADQSEMQLILGTEAMFEMDLPDKLSSGQVLTLGDSKYVLVEFLPNVDYEYLARGIFELQSYGFIPIIAHVERYKCLNKKKVEELVNMGARIQMNAESLMGKFGFFTKRYCNGLIREELVDFIASDAHDPNESNAVLNQCAALVEKTHGKKVADKLFGANAEALLQMWIKTESWNR